MLRVILQNFMNYQINLRNKRSWQILTTTNFNIFVDKLQHIISGGRTTGEDNLLVETGDSFGADKTVELNQSSDILLLLKIEEKNVEINTKFLRDVLQKISSNEQQMVLSQQFREDKTPTGTPKKPGDVERKAEVRIQINTSKLQGEIDDNKKCPLGRKDYTKLPVNKDEEIENIKILLEDLKQVYTNYRQKYEKQSGDEDFGSNYIEGSKFKKVLISFCCKKNISNMI